MESNHGCLKYRKSEYFYLCRGGSGAVIFNNCLLKRQR